MANPIILLHGYSDKGQSWQPWRARLLAQDPERRVLVCTYQSLVNEVSIKDIAEAFDRALTTRGGLNPDEPFDAIVHSTGMLVLRAWLATDPARVKRLKHLVALAPATYGSPLAKKGRSWLGAIFKGNRHLAYPVGTPFANLHVAYAHKFGLDIQTFGDSNGVIDL